MALTVELLNGGTRLQSTGNMYYSWDIRAVLFVLGLVFLLIYYKRYHMMRNLINEGGCLASLRRLPAAVCSSSRIPSSMESRVRLPSGSIALTSLR